ncbi:MAG: hypothetical protein J0I84_03320 [Terrimonas sp.]|nr:hypothetical protein [Terrimonas sp.]OJY88279.1 MAG: hypothetical protein BGP13_07035 [Sphingobacteriales bacterium 40-81]
MNRSIVKPIVVGVLIGTALFFIPFFVLRVIAFFLIAGLVFRLFAGRRRRFGRNFSEERFAFVDHIRNMSDEEYQAFKSNPRGAFGCGGFSRNQHSSTNQNPQ